MRSYLSQSAKYNLFELAFARTKNHSRLFLFRDFPISRTKHFLGAVICGQCDQIGNVLHIGQLFKAFGNNELAQISHILRQFLLRCQNLSFFWCNHFCATLIDIWQFLSGHTVCGRLLCKDCTLEQEVHSSKYVSSQTFTWCR